VTAGAFEPRPEPQPQPEPQPVSRRPQLSTVDADSSSIVDFRAAFRRHAAGVAVVTVLAGERPVGLTATSVVSVSLEPPLVSFGIARTASTWPAVRAARWFAVNTLGADQAAVARQFATSGIDRFAGVDWRLAEPGVPLLAGATAWLVCRVDSTLPAGDHALIVGQVLSASAGRSAAPLVYHDGRYLPGSPDPGW
jgi:flavin reductase (DIM6/NTAB) family NADH-FMN oxidoreductase RutF